MSGLKDLSPEQRLALFMDQAKDYGFVLLDPDGIIVEWSVGAEHLTGWTATEAVGQSITLIFTPEDRAVGAPEAELNTAREAGRSPDVRWHLCKDGSRFFVDGVTSAVRDSNGKLIGFGKILRDITERKQLADASDRQASLLDLSQDAVFSWDFDSRCILYWNKGACEVYGFTSEEAVGHYKVALLHTLVEGGVEAIMDRLKKHRRWDGVLTHTRKDGTKIQVESRMVLHTDLGDQPLVLETNRDVTQKKRTEENLRELAADLSEANRRKNEFLAVLAHELRNPLAPIRTGLELIRMNSSNPATVTKVREMMQRQIDHMVHLINDLLDIARINSGKVELKKARVDLKTIVTTAVESSLPIIESKQHELIVDVPDQSLWLDADENRLTQVLSNLLTNSAKYTPSGGRITLSARKEDGKVIVSVNDNGIGIPAESLPRLFEMFSQVDHHLGQSQGGLGIGLSLVKQLVEMHGGTVSASSAGTGQGSTFTVQLPLAQDKEAIEASTDRKETESDITEKRRLRILIADDNVDAAVTLAEMLEIWGHTVKIAHDGLQALDMAKALDPQFALLDIGMPGMNGYEVAEAIRRMLGDRTVLVALTGWGGKEDQKRSREAGFDHHITKPVDHSALKRLLALPTNSHRK
jgi:PAS domain S-box-containing protein